MVNFSPAFSWLAGRGCVGRLGNAPTENGGTLLNMSEITGTPLPKKSIIVTEDHRKC